MHLYTILWEIYRVVRGKRLEIHSTKVYNMLRAVMILHTIVRKSMIKFNNDEELLSFFTREIKKFIKQQSILFELIAVHLREALSGKFSVQAS